MGKYRKKPVVVEAFQMTKERRQDNSEWPNWLNIAWNKEPGEGAVWPLSYPESDGKDKLAVGSLQGVNIVEWGDWIVANGSDDLYACNETIFKQTYEKVKEV